MHLRDLGQACVITCVLCVITGCATGSAEPGASRAPTAAPTTAAPTTSRSPFVQVPEAQLTFSATARSARLRVFDRPDGQVVRTLDNPQASGAPLVTLVQERSPGWVRVQLPIRPNGTSGWVRTSDVEVARVRYRLDVRLGEHRLDLVRDGEVRKSYPIGVGTRDTPTPGGTFYLKELLRPPEPDSVYGAYAYGLSGFSTVLTSFAGGEGVIGIHGTNDPSSIGKDVSSGCIRLRNADITALTELLDLGTPVRILP